MKVKIEMDLSDLLRISVLLDHHRKECADNSERGSDASSPGLLFSQLGTEASQLNEKLLKAVSKS